MPISGMKTNIQANSKLFQNKKIVIVRTNYYEDLIDNLVKFYIATLADRLEVNNIENYVDIVTAPGTWEVPFLAKKLAITQKYEAIVAFGIIVKGETYHFEAIAEQSSRSLMDISINQEVPIIYEILAVYNIEQAQARCANNDKNKGIEAALATIQIIQENERIKNLFIP